MLTESYYHDTRYPLSPYTLPEVWKREAKLREGPKMTWVEPFEELTHRQRYNQAMLVAKGLLALGLKRGDTLCCFGSRGSDPALMFYACASLGIKFMSNFLYTPVDKLMKNIISKVKPDAVLIGDITTFGTFVSSQFIDVVKQLSDEKAAHKISHVIFDKKAEADANCPKLSEWRALSDVINEGMEKISDEVLESAKALVEKNEPCVYALSSGSTGDIKLVLIGAAAYTNCAIIGKLGIDRALKVFGIPDIATEDYAFYPPTVQSLVCDYDVVVFPVVGDRDEQVVISNILSAIEKYRVESVYTDQYYIMKIVNEVECRKGYDLSSLKCIITVGNMVGMEFKKRVLQLAPLSLDMYGCVEFFAGTILSLGTLLLRPASAGQLSPNVEAKVVDDNGDIVPVNARGQLLLRGYSMFLEYKDQPELTAAAKNKDGWLLTGDMVSMDEAGYLYVYGRMATSQRWKVASDVVYSIGIEAALRTHPCIRTCMVVGTTDENSLGHEINYVVEPAPGSALTADDVRVFAMEKMTSRLEWPMRVFLYTSDQLPRTSGQRQKLNRKALQEAVEARVAANPQEGIVWDEQNRIGIM